MFQSIMLVILGGVIAFSIVCLLSKLLDMKERQIK